MSAEHEPTIADVMNGLTRSRKHPAPRQPAEHPPARPLEPQWPEADAVPMVRLPDAGEQAAIVRPYAWTRGRTRSNFELRLETMVSTSSRAADASAFAESEHRAIGELCRDPRSVAEVATLLGAPLGVAKVLLGDMAQLGLVTVHKTATGGANRAHLVLMERVLSGLRRL
ncbi:DUF742 domain-containing protein [Actinokineospora sp. NPDC004072]